MTFGLSLMESARMTEADWLLCNDPRVMLEFLKGRISERKLRLFVLHCCRCLGHLFVDKPYRQAVDVAERFVEGLATAAELADAYRVTEEAALRGSKDATAGPLWLASFMSGPPDTIASAFAEDPDALAILASAATMEDATMVAVIQFCIPWAKVLGLLPSTMASILRDILHPPYRSVLIKASWRAWNAGITRTLAQAIYQDRVFQNLPILADALEEAGCTDADILNHCRQPGEHVRGCWVLDALLGKS
jgi:hypothetical protein